MPFFKPLHCGTARADARPTTCLSAETFICKLNCGRGRVMLGLDPSISGQGRVRTATPLPFSRMGEGGAERRMRACHLQQEGATAPSRFNDQRRSLTPAPLPSGRGVPRAPAQARTAIPRPRSHAGVTNEGQRSAARRVGYQAASVEPGCGADGLSHHPHAPWRSACRRFWTPGRAYRVESQPPPRALSTPVPLIGLSRRQAWDEGVMPATGPASSSHRDRIVPRAVPRSLPGVDRDSTRRRRAHPHQRHTSGWLPLGDEVVAS